MFNFDSLKMTVILSSILIFFVGCRKNTEPLQRSLDVPSVKTDTALSVGISRIQDIDSNKAVSSRYRENLLFESTFEEPYPLSKWPSIEKGCTYSIMPIDSVSKNGKKCVRFEINKTDPDVANGKRAELTLKPESKVQVERWYGLSFLFPKSYISDPEPETITQWHEWPDFDLGESWRSPPISLQTANGRLMLVILWAKHPVNIKPEGSKSIDLGPYSTESWIDFVFHIKFSWENDGLVEVWKNNKLVCKYTGPNAYNDKTGTYMKVGLYKWMWMPQYDKNRSTTTRRILYIDDIRVGNQLATFGDVTP